MYLPIHRWRPGLTFNVAEFNIVSNEIATTYMLWTVQLVSLEPVKKGRPGTGGLLLQPKYPSIHGI